MQHLDSFQEKLKRIGLLVEQHGREVVYGVTDTSSDSLFIRFQEFFINRSKVSLKEKSYFFHLLSVMLDAGIPIHAALASLAQQTSHERFRRVLHTLAHSVGQGRTLSDAMKYFPDVFSETELGVVKSGETIGRLDIMLSRLSSKLTQEYELKLKVKTALMYPVTVLVALVVATIVVMMLVMPTLQTLFAESGVSLPLLTRWLIAGSGFVGNFWWVFVILVVLLYLGYLSYRDTPEGKFRLHAWKLTFPVFGQLLKKIYVTRFVSVLGLLVEAGVPMNTALTTTAEALGNDLYRRKLVGTAARVTQGEKLSACLSEAPFLFPETVIQMLRVGEHTASIDKATAKIAQHYDREIDHTIRRITALFEPIMIVVVGLAVGLLAISILGPIFSLSEVI